MEFFTSLVSLSLSPFGFDSFIVYVPLACLTVSFIFCLLRYLIRR